METTFPPSSSLSVHPRAIIERQELREGIFSDVQEQITNTHTYTLTLKGQGYMFGVYVYMERERNKLSLIKDNKNQEN